MSIILRTLKKLIDKTIRKVDLLDESLHKTQHAYQGGKRIESAIHIIISILDKLLNDSEIALTMVIGISGAFDNT